MSKREIIDAILQHNRTAAPEFLARFAEPDLRAYLERVATVEPKRPMAAGANAQRAQPVMA